MKMALKDGTLFLIEADNTQFAIIKSWNKMRWNKQRQWLEGPATAELLNKLASITKLSPAAEAERQRLNSIQEAVDQERMAEEPAPLYRFPVKANLFKHQIRGVNMCLLTFGLINPVQSK